MVSFQIQGSGLPIPGGINTFEGAKEKGFKSDHATINYVKGTLKDLLRNLKVKGSGIDGGSLAEGGDVIGGTISAGLAVLKDTKQSLNENKQQVEQTIGNMMKLKILITKILDESDFYEAEKIKKILHNLFENTINQLGRFIDTDYDEFKKKIKNSKEFLKSLDDFENLDFDDEAAKLTLLVKGIYDVDEVTDEVKKSKKRVKELHQLPPNELFKRIVENLKKTDAESLDGSISKIVEKLTQGGRLVTSYDTPTDSDKYRKKLTLDEKLTFVQTMYKKVIEDFLKEVIREFNQFSKVLYNMGKSINKDIVYDKNLEEFITFLSNSTDMFNITADTAKWFKIIGFKSDPTDNSARDEFELKVHNLLNILKEVESTQKNKVEFQNLQSILKNVLVLINNYSDLIKVANENIKKLDIQTLRGYGINGGEIETFDGGDLSLNMELENLNNVNVLEQESHDIKKYLESIKLFGNIANIQQNLSFVSKNIKAYSENYDNLLGETMGFKKNEVKKYQSKVIKSINDIEGGIGYLLNKYNKSNAVTTAAQSPAFTFEPIHKNTLIKLCKWQCEARLQFYEVLETIDLFLANFTINLDANIKDIENLMDLLKNVKVNNTWFNENNFTSFLDKVKALFTDDKFMVNETIIDKLKAVTKLLNEVIPLKNLIALFSYMNNMSSYKLALAPKTIYKYMKNYMCTSIFICGFNNEALIKYKPTESVKIDNFKPEFLITIFMTKDLITDYYDSKNKAKTLTKIEDFNDAEKDDIALLFKKNQSSFDVFFDDDKYFLMVEKAMVSKILTSLSLYKSMKTPNKNYELMNSSNRLILGGFEMFGGNVTIKSELVELYIRLPLLLEFYKNIFDDGNKEYKDNQVTQKEQVNEIIAYIPDASGVWSKLISLVFDKSKYTSKGYYTDSVLRMMIEEINKIYESLPSDKKSIRGCIMELVFEVNKRYGVIKKKALQDYYNTIKTFTLDNPSTDVTVSQIQPNNTASDDILDDNTITDYKATLPSEKFTKNNSEFSLKLLKNQEHLIDDIPIIKDFRKKIQDMLNLTKTDDDLKDLAYNFKKYIDMCKNELKTASNESEKVAIVLNAMKRMDSAKSSDSLTNKVLFMELVLMPLIQLNKLYKFYTDELQAVLDLVKPGFKVNKTGYEEFMIHVKDLTFALKYDKAFKILNEMFKLSNGLTTLNYSDINNIVFEWSKLEALVSSLITQIKSNANKFSLLIDNKMLDLVFKGDGNEFKSVYMLEREFLNVYMRDDFGTSKQSITDRKTKYTFELFNDILGLVSSKLSTQPVSSLTLFNNVVFSANNSPLFDLSLVKNNAFTDTLKKLDQKEKQLKPSSKYTLVDKMFNFDPKFASNYSLVELFNLTLAKYINELYDPTTKKIYSKFLNNLSNTNDVQNVQGFPCLLAEGKTVTNGKSLLAAELQLESVISDINVKTIFTLFNRVLRGRESETKYHLLEDKNKLSQYLKTKYQTLLPRYKEVFTLILQKCLFMQKVMKINNTGGYESYQTIKPETGGVGYQPINNNTIMIDDIAYTKDITFDNYTPEKGGEGVFTKSRNLLFKLVETVQVVLSDIDESIADLADDKQQMPLYLEQKKDFIKNYKSWNDDKLPFMPLSAAMLYKDNNFLVMDSQRADMNWFYGLRSIIDVDYSKVNSLVNMPYFEQLMTAYSQYNKAYNKLDNKNVMETVKNVMFINQAMYRTNLNKMKEEEFKFSNLMTMLENNVTNKSFDEFLALFNIGSFTGKEMSKNAHTRKSSILINLIDLNIVPINIHALMREIPLCNVINYALTYDDIIDNEVMPTNEKSKIDTVKNMLKLNTSLEVTEYKMKDKQIQLFNNVVKLGKNPLVNQIVFLSNAQKMISLYIENAKDTDNKFSNVITGLDLLTKKF